MLIRCEELIPMDIRNIAIIAHVDHGKTTLVNEMLRQGGVFRENQVVEDRVMDSGDLERERGITILAKNTAIHYKDTKINIVDTPGHADFGGEVERVLKMVNGVLLLVDAAEGPMPQTRFVLSKALELGHRVIVVVNKIDRPDARVHEVIDEVLELLLELNATDEQLDSPMLFCSARAGTAAYSPEAEGTDLRPLFDTILEYMPAPERDESAPLQLLVSSLDYNDYVGRIAIGRIQRGVLRQNQEILVLNAEKPEQREKAKAVSLYVFDGLARTPVTEAFAGDIVALSGIGDVTIGDTICAPECPEALPFVKISAPTMEMTFSVNDSPFAGTEGKFVTSRALRDRLFRETLKDVSLRVTETDSTDSFNVAGRGEMHLSILIETMRREGFEFQVSPPRVLTKEENGVLMEPMEEVVIDVPDACVGSVIEKLSNRKGELKEMNPTGTRTKLIFLVPSRGLFGYRSEFLTDTRGEGIMASVFDSYAPMKGEVKRRSTGSLIAFETGEAVAYGIFNTQDRGTMFIGPGVKVYGGMVVGSCPKQEDIVINVCRKKQMTNMRASGSDEALRLVPPRIMSLEQCMEFLADDELLEVTPKSLRLRKRVLDHERRAKSTFRAKQSK
ncbi:MAG: translational GTPase TypA [Oscillospiraceae bacterium]|nr:translational GTPase TypA [Oscillospiraceae bacterium]